MNQKILRTELAVLSTITLFAMIGFYYQDALPDNAFTISSSVNDTSFFGYYLASLLMYVSYFSGPWILVPFLIQAITSAFYFSRRESWLDSLAAPISLIFFFSLSYFLTPTLVGTGLLSFGNSLGWQVILPLLLLTTPLYGYLVWRAGFFEFLNDIFSWVKSLKFSKSTNPFVQRLSLKDELKNKLTKTKTLLQSQLRGKSTESSSNDIEVTSDELEIDQLQSIESESPIVEVAAQEILPLPVPVKVITAIPQPKKKERVELKEYSSNDLLSFISKKSSTKRVAQPDSKYFEEIISRIEDKLNEFKIEGQIINILKGPVVDTFELELGPGVRVSRINSIAEDLSLALYGAPIRIVYPMKGRTTVGIEVPRSPRDLIYLDEVLDTELFKNAGQRLPIAMGKNAFGEPVIVDLASMPHMLVAGATGAGKSVFINTMLVSLLVKKSPDTMKLILVDPKQLELALYAKLPHLIMPVIIDARKASLAFMWAVQEMERRYSILNKFHVRNLDSFNEKLKTATPEMLFSISEYYKDDTYKLPYIVIVVDEFADLILTKAGKEIENNICRLAAKARAAGIHLVVATQRPSVDVITGLIKSNFPTRLSFRVTSDTDSRTILNTIGAEKLLGKGDMLYKYGVDMDRLHSAYVDENEIEALAAKLTEIPQEFLEEAVDFLENGGDNDNDPYAFGSHIQSVESTFEGNDPLYEEAVKTVVEFRAASASMLQRRLKVGYNRAANLIELMEARGVVGPAQGSKPRKILAAPQDVLRGE